MPEFEIKAEGFSELMEQLDIFCSPKIQVKLVQNAVKEAARPVKAEAERNLGRGKGYIAVGMPRRSNWGASTIAAIGIGIAKKHWQLIFREYGAKAHRIVAGRKIQGGRDITGVKKRGGGVWEGSGKKVLFFNSEGRPVFSKWADLPTRSPKPFVRPALDSKKNEALDRMRAYLELALQAIFERKNKDVPNVPEVS